MADGKYFRATNNKSLENIYSEIDTLEKTKITETEFRQRSEEFFPWALAGLCCLMMEFLLKYLFVKSATA